MVEPTRVSFRKDEWAVVEDLIDGAKLPLRLPRDRFMTAGARVEAGYPWGFTTRSWRGTRRLVVGEQIGEDGKTPPG